MTRLGACAACGATTEVGGAARFCGACGARLHTTDAPPAERTADSADRNQQQGAPTWLRWAALLAALAVVLVVASRGTEQPSTGPAQARGDAGRTGVLGPTAADAPDGVLWESDLGGLDWRGRRGVIVAGSEDGIVVVAAQRTLVALDLNSGALLWRRGDVPWSGTGPVVGDGIVVAVTHEVVAFELATGRERWSTDMSGWRPRTSSSGAVFPLAVAEGVVLISDGSLTSPPRPDFGVGVGQGDGLAALDSATGALRWTPADTGLPPGAIRQVIGSSGGHVVLGVDRYTSPDRPFAVVAVRLSDGSVAWSREVRTERAPDPRVAVDEAREVVLIPTDEVEFEEVALDNGAVVRQVRLDRPVTRLSAVSTEQGEPILVGLDEAGTVSAFSPTTGELRWRREVGAVFGFVGVSPTVIQLASPDGFVGLDPSSGEVLFDEYPFAGRVGAWPVDGTLLLGGETGFIEALDSDGSVRWQSALAATGAVALRATDDWIVTVTPGELAVRDDASDRAAWRYVPRSEGERGVGRWLASTRTVLTDRDVIVEELGPDRARIIALDLETGVQSWSATLPNGPDAAHMTVVDGTILVPSSASRMHRLDAATGRAVPDIDLSGYPGSPTAEAGVAFMALDAGSLYRLDDPARRPRIAAVDLTSGEVLWEQHMPICADPTVADGTLVVRTPTDVRALDPVDGRQLWLSEAPDASCTDVAATSDLVLVPDATQLRGLDLHSGSEGWAIPIEDGIVGPPTMAGDDAYVITPGGDIVAIDIARGIVEWRYSVGEPVTAPPALTDGRLVVITISGSVVRLG